MLRTICSALLMGLMAMPVCYGAETGEDAVFVSVPGHKGVYHRTTGKIVKLTPDELILEKDGRQILYEQGVVHSVELGSAQAQDKHDVANNYWNRKESQIVKAVQSTPIVGQYLSFLNSLPYSARTFLAVLVLLGAILYAAYQAYQVVVVATSLRNLSTEKLTMEVRKLRYDLETIEKTLGLTPAKFPERTATEVPAMTIMPIHFEVPQINIIDFVKHKLLRMLTEDEKKHRAELWGKKWEKLKKRSGWMSVAVYYWRMSINWVGTLFVALFCIGSFIDIFLPFYAPASSDPVNPSISVVFVIFFAISLAWLLRLNAVRRIIRTTYRESHVGGD